MIQNDLFLGEQIRLTALKEEDLSKIHEWYDDIEFLKMYSTSPAYPITKENLRKWFQKKQSSEKTYIFAIRYIESGEFIGYVELMKVNFHHQSATLGIAIGNPLQRGNGYGEEALELILNYGFRELNLHRIQLYVISYNEKAIGLYEKIGFKKEGVLREIIKKDGKRYDMYLYGLLEQEWKNK